MKNGWKLHSFRGADIWHYRLARFGYKVRAKRNGKWVDYDTVPQTRRELEAFIKELKARVTMDTITELV